MSGPALGAQAGAAVEVQPVVSHIDIVQSFCELKSAGPEPPRLGAAGQRPDRALEQIVRGRAVDVANRLAALGHCRADAAQRLGIPERTLRHWQGELRLDGLPVQPRGRPLAQSGPEQQQAVFSWLQDIGPGVGLPTLRTRFDSMARAELDEILKFYRRLWRAHNSRLLHVLHWQQPGTVWAMDFAEAPCPIDGLYPYLLAVRDLASGQQLLWLPVAEPTAAVTITALDMLFTIHGAPLVLKTDNGSAFLAEATRRFLERWQVWALFSPPRTPSYNGSIEASIGSLKTRTQKQAESAGHPGAWTADNAESARQEANATARPRRLQGATPDEVWASRPPLTHDQRQRFLATVERLRTQARHERQLPAADALTRPQQAALDRLALPRALVAHDLLLFRRRRIPAQIKRPRVTREG